MFDVLSLREMSGSVLENNTPEGCILHQYAPNIANLPCMVGLVTLSMVKEIHKFCFKPRS